jgi:serine/threonine-protein kinase
VTSSAGLAELQSGDRVGRYRVVELIGRGATGNVYRAVDEQLKREVALKMLAPEIHEADDTEVRALAAQRMVREARAAAAFSHPNAVAVFDAGELDGKPFIAMELVHGRLLRSLVGDAKVPLEERLRWLGDVARALAAAHRAGLVHRDVKPDNVIVGDDGVVKLLDFGVARRLPRSDGAPPGSHEASITIDGAIVGTPAYMPPEQLRGERVDGRADQFSWGVTAYELIAGKKPWTALSAPALIAGIIGREPDWLTAPGLSRPVAETVMRALAKSADERFASMDALLEALAGRAPALRRPPRVSPRVVQSVKAALGPLLFVLLFAAAAGGAWWYTRVPEPVELPPATPPITVAPQAASPLRFPCPPAARRAAATDDLACASGLQAWCGPDGRALACCPAGLAPASGANAIGAGTGTGAGTGSGGSSSCACPPGGSTARSDCARPTVGSADYQSTLDGAVRRAYLGCTPPNPERSDLALDVFIGPDGRAFDVLLLEAYSADARLQRCVVDGVRALRLAPPPEGFARLSWGRR